MYFFGKIKGRKSPVCKRIPLDKKCGTMYRKDSRVFFQIINPFVMNEFSHPYYLESPLSL